MICLTLLSINFYPMPAHFASTCYVCNFGSQRCLFRAIAAMFSLFYVEYVNLYLAFACTPSTDGLEANVQLMHNTYLSCM